jgi:HEAT repeat protein
VAVTVLTGVDGSAETDVRLFAARALGREATLTRCPAPTAVVDSLVGFASDPDEDVRTRALSGLGTAAERYPARAERHLDEVVAPAPELAVRLRGVASDPGVSSFCTTVAVELLLRT